MLKQYLSYRTKAIGKQGIHSPYVFDFYNRVVRFKNKTLTHLADNYLEDVHSDKTPISITEFGAGSKKQNNKLRVQDLARKAGSTKRWGRFLFKASEHFGGNKIIELGTNLGIGTAYLCAGNPSAEVFSFEGSKTLSNYAEKQLALKGLNNATVRTGKIQDTLKKELNRLGKVDLVYIDADHTYDATMTFYHIFKAHIHNKSVIIFDDIYWSEGMTKAWQEIIAMDEVRISIDLFFKGIITFDPGLTKQHFILKH